MKNILIITLLIFIAGSLYSQDLIVTNDGDSINCRITKVKTDNIYFTFKHKDEIRNTLLPVTNVNTHHFDYYQTSDVPEEKIVGYKNYPQFRIALNGGYSYLTAPVAEGVPNYLKGYVKELKSGFHISGDISYYFSEPLGIGFKYNAFKSSNSIYSYGTAGVMSDQLRINFIAPTFSTRILNHNKSNAFLMNLSVGYLGYSNDKIMIDKYKMTGSTVGLSFDIGYDIGLSENAALGFQISFMIGALSEYDWHDGIKTERIKLESDEYESLSRIDLTIGLRFVK